MAKLIKCCVGGCDSTSATHRLFKMPQNDKHRSLWMSFLVPYNSLLIGLSKYQLLNKRVCHKHFERCQLDGQGRRTRYGYPSLFSPKEIEYGMPLSSGEYNVLADHNYYLQPEEDTSGDNNEIFPVIEKADDDQIHDHSYLSSTDQTKNLILSAHTNLENTEPASPASWSEEQESSKIDIEVPTCSFQEAFEASATPVTKKKVSTITKKIGTKKRKLMQGPESIATENLGISAMESPNEAHMLSQNNSFLSNFDALSPDVKTLLTMQLKLVRRNKMGRRFTIEEKLFALSLMKKSPGGYELWEKMFTLPSTRTLNRLSQKISLELGISRRVRKSKNPKRPRENRKLKTKKKTVRNHFSQSGNNSPSHLQ